ncbi:hypothetical protein BT63DRAFT_99507 [Microthyrium microscopicum]|uniref:Gag1-like clamp domain-containing protein n=1 Tax=Microthyrium microscopicum TaxID=703497 RepID=A0A6A6TZF8_9PEZI|nr:hypothetical protein BT63DRAFT_99507 [Microthyrium microscopicum]
MAKPSQAQVREINRTLLATVRADWRFPATIPSKTAEPSTPSNPITYRERFYSTSDDSDAEEEDDFDTSDSLFEDEELSSSGLDETESNIIVTNLGSRKAKRRPKFDTPDSVADYLEHKIQARKKRKVKALNEEISWNEGLCFFLQRRNAWTSAVSPEAANALRKTKDTIIPSSSNPSEETLKKSTSEDQASASTTDNDSGIAVSPSSLTKPTNSPFAPPADISSLTDVLLPISTPFLPNTHPVRASIMARTDSELYEKIVRDSRTPAVPINLAHMMRVIVQGWKDEGNWPPRGAAAESSITARRSNVSSAKASHATEMHKGIFSNHKHLQRGVESVRRVLRLSGSAPPPGD